MAGSVVQTIALVAHGALNALLPPICPLTGEPVATAGAISARGWRELQFVDDPACARCGAPFAIDYGEGSVCAACEADPPVFEQARAALLYNDASHELIVSFKHRDRTDLAPTFANWLARPGRAMIDPDTVIAPTPLHRRRLLARRYNQAALLGEGVARRCGGIYEPRLFERHRATPPQKHLSAAARRRNVAGAFAVRAKKVSLIANRHIVIVDDVLTTGATLSACARVAYRAGAARVDALVVARVVKAGQDAI